MGEEALRRENERLWRQIIAFNDALIDLPEVPPVAVLDLLSDAGARGHMLQPPKNFGAAGKMMQRQYGLDAIPPNSECEAGAGYWKHLRERLLRPD
ncbi:hypothetical protein GCM10007276_12480 [Agaricicola taiwanensis]|uniref:Uncharacterized protein n=1 Tax=Agaricicola taiwanensis TaxID=591372 RepID=A0A8J2VRT1_9RHOB|nr:hypothetical protein [Agaricicola taiwanensis]GGE36486.1 hypothetical protein GCM10007276_12480 [Agaricicola taiwanensis]